MEKKSLFTKSSDGSIFLKGSGNYYREKKKQFSSSENPYNQMYLDQVSKILKGKPQEIKSMFSL
jgi:hypothetical protein